MPSKKPKLAEAEAQVADSVAYLMERGFLNGWKSLLPDSLQKEITERAENFIQWAEEDGTPYWRIEAFLAGIGGDRVWWNDCECDPQPDYPEIIGEWAKLTLGKLTPDRVEEEWADESVAIRVHWNGAIHELQARNDGDWLDLAVLFQLNAIIPESTGQFCYCAQDDQTAQVLFLTLEEIEQLRARGWVLFARPEDVPARKPIDWSSF